MRIKSVKIKNFRSYINEIQINFDDFTTIIGKNSCALHPITRRDWLDNDYIRYAADMNVALAYYNCLDDWQDDGKRTAKWMAQAYESHLPDIEKRWPRQCQAIKRSIDTLSALEKENCPNPDEPAGAFGELKKTWMAKLNDDCLFISAKNKENIDEFREVLYKKVRELHVQKYPYNDFLYQDYE